MTWQCLYHTWRSERKHALYLETWGDVSVFDTIISNDVGGSGLDS